VSSLLKMGSFGSPMTKGFNPVGVNWKMKGMTFNKNIIKSNWRRINEGPLKKAGLMVRNRAISKLRKVSRTTKSGKISKTFDRPGNKYPKSRDPQHRLRRIYSVPNWSQTTVYIGPVGFPSHRNQFGKMVPEVLEYGGPTIIYEARATKGGNKKWVPAGKRSYQKARGRMKSNMFRQTWRKRTVRIKERPFMRDSLAQVQAKLPELWRGSIKRAA